MDRITSAQQQLIVTAVRAGSFPIAAAASAGVPAPTVTHWLRRGRRARSGRYRAFWVEVRQARRDLPCRSRCAAFPSPWRPSRMPARWRAFTSQPRSQAPLGNETK